MNLRAYYSRLIRLAVLLGALALLLVGCDLPWQAKQSDMAKDQTLKMGWSTGGGPDITTLDPAQCVTRRAGRLSRCSSTAWSRSTVTNMSSRGPPVRGLSAPMD